MPHRHSQTGMLITGVVFAHSLDLGSSESALRAVDLPLESIAACPSFATTIENRITP